MYPTPYTHLIVAEVEEQRRNAEIERRRFVREHADQIVPRPAGAMRRMLRRVAARSTGSDAAAGQRHGAPATAR